MIALLDGMPLIQLDDGRVVTFQHGWIIRALWKAAAKAGYRKWWLAGQVAQTAVAYLAGPYERNAISVPRLTGLLRDILQVLGYGEIAPYLELGQPGERLDLMDLVKAAGAGYELAFFNQLRDRLLAVIGRGTTEVDLVGLTPCVKKLRSRKSWTRECDALQEDIISFVRTQTQALPVEREISVQVR